MGRKPGFVMSDEQKAAMKAGREKARANKILIGIIKPELLEKKPKEPKEGKRVMTAEHKAAIQVGRQAARERKLAQGIPLRQSKKTRDTAKIISTSGNPVVLITGKEKDAFDFYTPLRNALRPRHLYGLLDRVIREITDKDFWMNPQWVMNKLSSYVTLEIA
jgi:hypothetical protein